MPAVPDAGGRSGMSSYVNILQYCPFEVLSGEQMGLATVCHHWAYKPSLWRRMRSSWITVFVISFLYCIVCGYIFMCKMSLPHAHNLWNVRVDFLVQRVSGNIFWKSWFQCLCLFLLMLQLTPGQLCAFKVSADKWQPMPWWHTRFSHFRTKHGTLMPASSMFGPPCWHRQGWPF